ncbi:hypothetical protein QFC24_001204 [Naganishia onofrii]|uniref:Uncharacterized protein n=1 Tax=Naganishia onofrii TaxID=1851511 RepID=A0ACC2XSZ3_9TREE|nr:hypothetical protein QFC24_001204 [Naganishia onofrii]
MSLFGQNKRPLSATTASKSRRSPLPLSNSDAVREKFSYSHSRKSSLTTPIATASSPSGWFTVLYIPVPSWRRSSSRSDADSPLLSNGFHGHTADSRGMSHVRVFLPIPPAIWNRIPGLRRLTPIRLLLTVFLVVGSAILFTVLRKVANGKSNWTPPNPFQDPDTLVLTQEEVARIWEWELISGHHPSIQPGKPSSEIDPSEVTGTDRSAYVATSA